MRIMNFRAGSAELGDTHNAQPREAPAVRGAPPGGPPGGSHCRVSRRVRSSQSWTTLATPRRMRRQRRDAERGLTRTGSPGCLSPRASALLVAFDALPRDEATQFVFKAFSVSAGGVAIMTSRRRRRQWPVCARQNCWRRLASRSVSVEGRHARRPSVMIGMDQKDGSVSDVQAPCVHAGVLY